jgi:hypothetical protein
MYGFLKGEQIAELERKDLTALHPPVTLTGDQLKGGLTND